MPGHARATRRRRTGVRTLTRARVAVVGAGLSGASLASALGERADVVLVEQSRGVGGRMATRRIGSMAFDHGAQYFTVRDAAFARRVDRLGGDGFVAEWTGRVVVLEGGRAREPDAPTRRYVGVPSMSALCRQLVAGRAVHLGFTVERLERDGSTWWLLRDGDRLGPFDAVAVTAPAPQASALLSPVAPLLAAEAARVRMRPCWAVMVGLPTRSPLPFDGAFVQDSPLSWVARSSSKVGRSDEADCWVLHASARWSEAHLEDEPEAVGAALLAAFWDATGAPAVEPAVVASHRWRHSIAASPLERPCLWDGTAGIGAAGDWCGAPRVEGAFLSGLALAKAMST